jgi:hypothetical protein
MLGAGQETVLDVALPTAGSYVLDATVQIAVAVSVGSVARLRA